MALEQQQNNKQAIDDNLFSWIRINKHFFRTLPGILKILQIILGIVCLILASPAIHATTQWFLYVVIICIVVTVIWCFVYLLSVKEAVNFPINWPLTEMLNMCFLAIICIIASIFQISHWIGAHHVSECFRNITAGVFGAVNFILYLISSCLSYTDWKQTHTISS